MNQILAGSKGGIPILSCQRNITHNTIHISTALHNNIKGQIENNRHLDMMKTISFEALLFLDTVHNQPPVRATVGVTGTIPPQCTICSILLIK